MPTPVSTPLLLITKDPSHPLATLALRYARAWLDNQSEAASDNPEPSTLQPALKLFFYGDGARTANRLYWQSADQSNVTHDWQSLAKRYQMSLPVCVSTALSRGVSDEDNSARHQLTGDNIATGFELVGLSELALMLQDNCRLLAF